MKQDELVGPERCACRGAAPQMREHTEQWCSIVTTAELNELAEGRFFARPTFRACAGRAIDESVTSQSPDQTGNVRQDPAGGNDAHSA